MLVAVPGDRHAVDQLHDEIGSAGFGGPGVEDRAILGWSIMARAWRSASNRAMTCRLSMPALMTLRATVRRTGWVCSAMKTVPMPALADRLEELVRADDRAGVLVEGNSATSFPGEDMKAPVAPMAAAGRSRKLPASR